MNEKSRRLKRAKQTRLNAIKKRELAKAEAESAIVERDKAIAEMKEIRGQWQYLAQNYGVTRSEVEAKLASEWSKLASKQLEMAEKEGEIHRTILQLEEIQNSQKIAYESLKEAEVALEEKQKQLETKESLTKEREMKILELEKELREKKDETKVKKLQRRLHNKAMHAKENEKRLLGQSNALHKELGRLTKEHFALVHRHEKTEEALTMFCERFNLKVVLDIFQGKPIWITSGHSVKIPKGGIVLEFLDESITITREDFSGEEVIAFELFAQFINRDKGPERWRVGLRDGKITLFARGLYKPLDLELREPVFAEDDDKIKLSPISDLPSAKAEKAPESAKEARKKDNPSQPTKNTSNEPNPRNLAPQANHTPKHLERIPGN